MAHLGDAACAHRWSCLCQGHCIHSWHRHYWRHGSSGFHALRDTCRGGAPLGDGARELTQDYATMPYVGPHCHIVHIMLGDVCLTGIELDFLLVFAIDIFPLHSLLAILTQHIHMLAHSRGSGQASEYCPTHTRACTYAYTSHAHAHTPHSCTTCTFVYMRLLNQLFA